MMKRAPAVVSSAEEQAAIAAAVESLRGLRDLWTTTTDAGDRAKLVSKVAGNLAIVKLADPVQLDVWIGEVATITGSTKAALRAKVSKAPAYLYYISAGWHELELSIKCSYAEDCARWHMNEVRDTLHCLLRQIA